MRILLITILLLVLSTAAFPANSANRFGGIGIDGSPLPDGRIKIEQIVSGGPAHQAGIMVGDIITHIDGKATAGSDFQQMVQKRLRGVSGAPVVLKIKRPGVDKSLVFELKRRQMIVTPKK